MISYADSLNKDDLFELYKKLMTKAEELSSKEEVSIVDKDWKENIPISQKITSTGNYLLLAKNEETSITKCEILRVENFQCDLSSIDYHGKMPDELGDEFAMFMLKKMPKEWEEKFIESQLDDMLSEVGYYAGVIFRAANDFRKKFGDTFDYLSQRMVDDASGIYSPDITNKNTTDFAVSVCRQKICEHIDFLKQKNLEEEEEKQ